MSDYRGDLISIETADGLKWSMPDGERFITASGGFGMPPVEYITSHQYRQGGEIERGYVLDERVISLTFHERVASRRALYWQARADWIDLLRQNRGGPLTLTIMTPTGGKRAIACYADPGPMMPPVDEADSVWQVAESINLRAFDPIWRDPTIHQLVGVRDVTSGGGKVFPMSYPVTFGPYAGAVYSFSLMYAGTYDSFPTITIVGPYNKATFVAATGATFELDTPIGAGEVRIIDLEPPGYNITDGAGVNKIGELGEGFDLIHFKIAPQAYAAPSAQVIAVILEGSTLASSVTFTYYDRYIGI